MALIYKNAFGQRLFRARIDVRMTLRQLGHLAGVKPSLLSAWEHGRSSPGIQEESVIEPGERTVIERLERALGLQQDELHRCLAIDRITLLEGKGCTYGNIDFAECPFCRNRLEALEREMLSGEG